MFCCTSKSILEATYESTEKFVLPIREGKIVKVYDGDTVTIAFRLSGKIFRTQVRLIGIDTPEIKGSSNLEKVKAIEVRDALTAKIMNKMVKLEKCGTEKYGRLLAEIWFDGENVNQWMLDKGYAVPYDGGTKTFNWGKFKQNETSKN